MGKVPSNYSSIMGELAVLNFLDACYRKGFFYVSRHVGADPSFDVVLHNADVCWRIQVKTASLSRRGYWAGHPRRTPEWYKDVTLFVFWRFDKNKFWLVPPKELWSRQNKPWKGRDRRHRIAISFGRENAKRPRVPFPGPYYENWEETFGKLTPEGQRCHDYICAKLGVLREQPV